MLTHHSLGALRVFFAFTLVVSILFLSGCQKAYPISEPVTITFLYLKTETPFYEEAVEAFHKKASNITVNLESTDMEGNWSVTTEKVDCFTMPVTALVFFIPPVLDSNGVEAIVLDDMIAQDKSFRLSDFYPGPLQLLTRNGKIYGIPSGVNPMVMYYNKDLFDKMGVPYPKNGWTWDDFLNTAMALRNEEERIWGYVPMVGVMDAILFIYQGGGRIVDDWQNPTRVTFTDPKTVQALEWYASLFHKHKVAPISTIDMGTGNSYQGAANIALLNGKVGMWVGSYIERGGRYSWSGAPWPFQSGMVALPRGEKASTYQDAEAYAISSKSEHIQACWQWISFLSRQTSREALMLPARKSQIESAQFADLVGADIAAVARDSLETALPPPNVQNLMQFPGIGRLGDGVEAIIRGRWTPQEAMDSMQEQGK